MKTNSSWTVLSQLFLSSSVMMPKHWRGHEESGTADSAYKWSISIKWNWTCSQLCTNRKKHCSVCKVNMYEYWSTSNMHTRACEDLGDVSVLASIAASVTLWGGAGTAIKSYLYSLRMSPLRPQRSHEENQVLNAKQKCAQQGCELISSPLIQWKTEMTNPAAKFNTLSIL